MTIGTVTGVPSGRFAFPRSYVRAVGVRAGAALPIWTGRRLDLVDAGSGATFWTTIFKEEFWEWSSNRYTLDWIVEEVYYIPFPGSPKLPLDVVVSWIYEPLKPWPTITVNPFPGQPFLYDKVLEPAPSDYWNAPWYVP